MTKNKIERIEKIEKIYEVTSKIVVYGAGRVSHELILYLFNHLFDIKKICCILVSDEKNNPSNIQGIPVYAEKKFRELKIKDVSIIVAAFEKNSRLIYHDLSHKGYKNIAIICDTLYEELCWRNRYFYDEHLLEEQYEFALKEWYKNITGLSLNLENPVTYNEKIQWIKLYGITPLMTELTDKYQVREWIKNKIGEQYLVTSFGVWSDFKSIDLEKLPDKFVLKCTHGCAWNEIVKNKKNWNPRNAKEKFDNWININYAFRGGLQLQYKNIVPRIIAEQYLENENGELFDYKFWCFNGKVEFIMFLSERTKNLRMNNYNKEWELLPFTYNYSNSEKRIKRPEKLEEMISLAEKLAKGFPHVRVDLYLLNDGTIKFGEMTFTSCNGTCRWSNEAINKHLGKLINCCVV